MTDKKNKTDKTGAGKRKESSSPVCYMAEFPEYFGGESPRNGDDLPKPRTLRKKAKKD